jgi:hypothetical protein
MPDPVTGIGAAVSIGGSVLKGKATSKAGKLQVASEQEAIAQQRAAIEEQRLAREELRTLLNPYIEAGGSALQGQMAALGLAGPEAQQEYVSQQEQSPIFQALKRQQEEALLQNVSATGGLRGGNVQGALAQFRPALLNQFLDQQYGRLGGISEQGQQSATQAGTAGMLTANQIGGNLTNIGTGMKDIGASRAGSALAQGQMYGDILGSVGGVAKGLLGGGINGSINRMFKSSPGIF